MAHRELNRVEVSDQIQKCQNRLLEAQIRLEKMVKDKAISASSAEYDKQMELAIANLHGGETKIPVTLVKDIAKGKCSRYLANRLQAEMEARAIESRIKVYQSILNGWQSIKKDFDVV